MLEQILRKINDKGWNVYDAGNEEGLQEFVLQGPAHELEMGKQYVLLPIINQPGSFVEVQRAMERMRHESVYPIVHQGTVAIPVAILIVNEKDVTVRGQFDFQMDYRGFLTVLDGLEKVRYYSS